MVFIDRLTRFCGGSRTLARLLAVNIGLALLLWVTTGVMSLSGADSGVIFRLTALPSDPRSFAGHPWTLLTYSLAHFSVLHLLVNMLWLYWFGRMFCDVRSDSSLLRLYIGAGVAGGVFYIAASMISGHAPGAYLTGASAAVLGIVTATGMLSPTRRTGLFLLGEVKLKWVALGCILLTLIGSYGTGIPTQAAHAGGIAAGIGWCLANRRVKSPGLHPGLRLILRKKVAKRGPEINARRAARAMSNTMPDTERLDQLLDKIRISGYDSLSRREKSELNYISSRLEANNQ